MSASKWKSYPEYKKTNLQWYPEIPIHWALQRMKHVASVQPSNVDKKKYDGQKEVRLANYVDVYHNDKITQELELMIATASDSEIEKFSLQKDDIIITKDSETWNDIAVPAFVPESMDGVVCGYHLSLIRPIKEHVEGEFLFRTYQAIGVQDQYHYNANGVTRYGLGSYWVNNGVLPSPPIEEQKKIVKFINRNISWIKSNIEKLTNFIPLLEEKRSAIITKTVTKGLKSDIPMKDSGIDWIGDIPEHWFCAKNLRLIDVKGRVGWHGLTTADYVDDGNYLLGASSISESGNFSLRRIKYVPNEIYERDKTIQVIDGDILIVKVGATIGRSTVVRNLDRNATINAALFLVRPNQELYPEYFQYQLMSSHYRYQMDIQTAESAQGNLFKRDFVQMKTIVPPYAEQQEIAERIEKELSIIEDLISLIRIQIDKLKQYHDAVISAAVTGKIDVRSL